MLTILPYADILNLNDGAAVVVTVNCVGVMGKGIALEFARKYPKSLAYYKDLCKNGKITPGSAVFLDRECGQIAAATKNHWRAPSTYEWVFSAFTGTANLCREAGIKAVNLPALGCGNGNLSFFAIRDWLNDNSNLFDGIEARVYEPANAGQRTWWP